MCIGQSVHTHTQPNSQSVLLVSIAACIALHWPHCVLCLCECACLHCQTIIHDGCSLNQWEYRGEKKRIHISVGRRRRRRRKLERKTVLNPTNTHIHTARGIIAHSLTHTLSRRKQNSTESSVNTHSGKKRRGEKKLLCWKEVKIREPNWEVYYFFCVKTNAESFNCICFVW